MSTSAINIGVGDGAGSKDAAVVVTADTQATGALLQWCEIDSNANCITPLGSNPVNTIIGETAKFFAVFAFDQTNGAGIALDPANKRVFLRFKNANGTNYSVTSTAILVPMAD